MHYLIQIRDYATKNYVDNNSVYRPDENSWSLWKHQKQQLNQQQVQLNSQHRGVFQTIHLIKLLSMGFFLSINQRVQIPITPDKIVEYNLWE